VTGINSSEKYASGDIVVLILDKGSSQCIYNSSLQEYCSYVRSISFSMTVAHFPKVFQNKSICKFSEIKI
jgi:hypothetical protein